MSDVSRAWGCEDDDEAVYSSLGFETRGGTHLSDIRVHVSRVSADPGMQGAQEHDDSIVSGDSIVIPGD